MRKKIVNEYLRHKQNLERNWLDLEQLVEVELSSEDPAYPIEAALLPHISGGWRASKPGRQTIRLLFSNPQRIDHIRLDFLEQDAERTQEYLLRWSPDNGQSYRDIVRQQWNFSPSGATTEIESYDVDLAEVTILELSVTPDIGNRDAIATLKRWQIAG